MNSIVSLIPFRTLVAIGKALGGGALGFDANRVPGGKAGVTAKLVSMYGEAAIEKAWREGAADAPPSTPPPQGNDSGDENAPAADNADGDATEGDQAPTDGDAPAEGDAQGDEAPADTTPPPGAKPSQKEVDSGDDAPEANQAPAPTDGDAPEGEPCPAPDATPPEPSGNPMDDHIRTIARQEAVKASAPIADWINDPAAGMRSHVDAWISEGLREAIKNLPQQAPTQGDAPEGMPQRAPFQKPTMPRGKGAAIHHRLFPKLLALMSAGVQVLLLGPAGTGKSHACRAAATHLGKAYADISLSSGASESNLTGWLLPTGDNGRFSYVPSPFVTMYEHDNSAFLFDELDAASPDMLVVVNAALANGAFTLAQRFENPRVVRGADVSLLAACNTLNGADENYSGRQPVEGSTADRFYVLQWGYDENLERAIAGLPGKQTYWKGTEPDTSAAAQEYAMAWVHNVRAAAARANINRIVSGRMATKYIAALSVGVSHKEAQTDLLTGWTRDEMQRLGDLAPGKNHYAPVPAPAV